MKGKPWKGSDIEKLIDNWRIMKPKQIAKLLNRSQEAVNIKARELELKKERV